ncbi:MAG: aspartate aminotransferase family protein [Planctomycetes bacterium]|nr:aspartate aminotransferase family protein [Planctomycetota bacterium]
MPGGVSSNIRSRWKPFPLFYSHGKGSRVWDVDGNEYIDYVLGRGPLLLGHSPAPVLEAVKRQLDRGLMYAGQHELEIEAAETISRLVPCAERVRFSNSGSEAVHMALRLARAATGRAKHVRFEGHYHGWFDSVFYSTAPKLEDAGPREAPRAVPVSKGQSPGESDNVIVLPWNDLALVEKTLSDLGREIAALITEPVMCNSGGILPKPGFLEGLRTLCTRHGVVLIFDEVITGFRLAPGGAQEKFGVTPDLATFAKAVAGGFCVSVLAGKAALMDEIAALSTVHAGTYNSNPPCMAACKAALDALTADDGAAFRRIQARGEALMKGIRELGLKAGKRVSVRGLPPCLHVSFGEPEEVVDYRTYSRRDAAAQDHFWEALQDAGVRIVPEGTWFVSAAHSEEDVARTLEAVSVALRAV